MADYGVIFDMDGVLIDSFDAHLRTWLDLAHESGAQFTPADFDHEFGRTSREIIRAYWPAPLDDRRIQALDDRKELLFRRMIQANFPVMAGATALLDDLAAAGIRVAVGSSGPPENVQLTVQQLGPWRFQATVTAADVTRGKPEPEVFLKAAQKLGLPASRCLVVEDAAAGVEAANRAGAVSVGYPSTGRYPEQLEAADHLISSLGELDAQRVMEWIDGKCDR